LANSSENEKSPRKISAIARGIAMLAFCQIVVENRNKISAIEEPPAEGIEQRGKSADGGCVRAIEPSMA
jgi:hypothetical protein